MPFNVKLQIIFQSLNGYGWTEQHYRLSSASVAPDLQAVIDAYRNFCEPHRRFILGGDCIITGYRASTPLVNAIASKPVKVYLPGTADQVTSSQNDSLATVIQDASRTRKKIIHMRGPWDVVIAGEAYHPENAAPADYNLGVSNYVGNLINNGFGWLGKSSALSTYGVVSSYNLNIDGTVTFNVGIGPGSSPLPPNGSIVTARFSKLNRSNSVLNRTFVVEVTNGTLTTVNPVAASEFTGKGRYYINVPVFLAYAVQGPVSLGERRMGRPLGRYPGRGRRRPVT